MGGIRRREKVLFDIAPNRAMMMVEEELTE
jgi:hypothetical protein